SWTTSLNAGVPVFTQGSSVAAGAQLSTDLKSESRSVSGFFSGGVRITTSGSVGFNASRGATDWSFAAPAVLNLDVNSIGLTGWGAGASKYELAGFPLSVNQDLSQPPGPPPSPGPPGAGDPSILST